MAKENNNQTAFDEALIENAGKTEKFFSKNKKLLTWIAAIILVAVAGFFIHKYFIKLPKQQKASEEMFTAIQYFNAEQYQMALEGDGQSAGFLEIVDEYDGTPQASLAAHYAGACYYNMADSLSGQALNYLTKYEATEGSPADLIYAQNLAMQADIHVNNGNLKKAAELYRSAIKEGNNNVYTTPIYLKKLGLVEEALGNNKAALDAFNRAYEEFGLVEVAPIIGRLQVALK